MRGTVVRLPCFARSCWRWNRDFQLTLPSRGRLCCGRRIVTDTLRDCVWPEFAADLVAAAPGGRAALGHQRTAERAYFLAALSGSNRVGTERAIRVLRRGN